MGRDPKKDQAMGRGEAIQNWIVYFQRYHYLSVPVCNV